MNRNIFLIKQLWVRQALSGVLVLNGTLGTVKTNAYQAHGPLHASSVHGRGVQGFMPWDALRVQTARPGGSEKPRLPGTAVLRLYFGVYA